MLSCNTADNYMREEKQKFYELKREFFFIYQRNPIGNPILQQKRNNQINISLSKAHLVYCIKQHETGKQIISKHSE